MKDWRRKMDEEIHEVQNQCKSEFKKEDEIQEVKKGGNKKSKKGS